MLIDILKKKQLFVSFLGEKRKFYYGSDVKAPIC